MASREPGSTLRSIYRELARAQLPTRYGDFEVVSFTGPGGTPLDELALVRGDVEGAGIVPVRLHSECVTGDALGSIRCDCGEQLHVAMRRLAESECGVLLYMRQEGRGIGIGNKIRAYALQDEGMDTVQANVHLGFDDDMRRYDVAAGMLLELGARRIELHTNNPHKVEGLEGAGIVVVKRVPIIIEAREENRFYLDTKRVRQGHLISEDE
jgi:GTP cyclohydrolase II